MGSTPVAKIYGGKGRGIVLGEKGRTTVEVLDVDSVQYESIFPCRIPAGALAHTAQKFPKRCGSWYAMEVPGINVVM